MVHFSGVTGTEAAALKEINGIAAKANALTTVNKYAFLFVMDLIPLDLVSIPLSCRMQLEDI